MKGIFPDIGSGYYGQELPIFLVHSGCLEKQKEIAVFIHGSPGDWSDYKSYLMSENLRSRFCIITLDRPGFGKSSPNKSLPDIKKQAYFIGDAIKQFKSEFSSAESRTVFVGHSYGGPVASYLVLTDGKRQDTLVLISASVDHELEEIQWYNRLAANFPFTYVLPDGVLHSNEEMFPLKNQLKELSNDWKETIFQVVIIHGNKDTLVPFENINFVKNKSKAQIIESIEIEGEGHFIPWTQTELVTKTLLKIQP
jgi:pimeloyl-ACP methyl ester carboxylesterase